jgi:4'-phosphopantetheinyl transferase
MIVNKAVCKKPETMPILSPGEIHLWQVSTHITAADFEEYESVLSEVELSKVLFFKSKQAKESYIASQGALRFLLSQYLGIAPNLVKLGRQKKGKPFSLDDQGLHFNLSNSGKLVVIAFSRDSELGIDIEKLRPLPDLDEMIETNFTSREIKFINTKPEERLRRFFRFWTVKESYLKAIGEGMRLAPENIEFLLEKESIKLLSVKGIFEQEAWNFKEFPILTDYVCTITYGKDNSIIKKMQLK